MRRTSPISVASLRRPRRLRQPSRRRPGLRRPGGGCGSARRGAGGAAGLRSRHLARWPVDDRFAERHLRRFLSLGYVLSDRLRAHWDSVALTSHLAARATARALVQARAGDLTAAGELPPAYALCFLPLPWSVELAARLAAAGRPHGHELGRWLADPLGRRSTGSSADGHGRPLPREPHSSSRPYAPPAHRTQIAVIGPMRLTRDGVPVDAPELRRARVRQLLVHWPCAPS